MGEISDLAARESRRISALYRYGVLDTPEDPAYDRITEMAARLFESPFAVLAFVDRDRQWFKSRFGLSLSETPRAGSFAEHVILSDDPLVVVSDAAKDDRFGNAQVMIGGVKVRV